MNKAITPQNCNAIPTNSEEERLEALLHHLEQLLPDPGQRAAFRRSAHIPPPTSVRLNRLIPHPPSLRTLLQERSQAVDWCGDAFVLPHSEKGLGHTLEHILGAFYIQAKATTLAVEALAPQPGERVLDMAAAPGGKAIQMAGHMQNTGLLVANEAQSKRMPALVGNLERCGVFNAIITLGPGTLMARYFHNYFDRVLLDAPCSGDGIVRKDRSMLRYWSPSDAVNKSKQQKGLLRAAFHTLRPGGTLVYSTCALSLEENEEVMRALLKKYPGQVEILPIDGIDPMPLPRALASTYPAEFGHFVRIWPHQHETEGAFVAKIRKKDATVWPVETAEANSWSPGQSPETALNGREQIEAQWNFIMPRPTGQIVDFDRRHLLLTPELSTAFKQHYPHFLRAGMHIARPHKGHFYLSQQAFTLWGTQMRRPRLELTWPQLQNLFQYRSIQLDEQTTHKGEVLCSFGPWSICRGIVEADGYTLQSMLPKALHTATLSTLFNTSQSAEYEA